MAPKAPADPMTDAMMLAAQNPEQTQAVAQAAVSGANAARSAGGGDLASGAKVMAGAAAVGGLTVGMVAGSTILGVAAAGGAAYAATRKDGVGDAAKATGKAAVMVAGKAQEFNKEHHVTEKAAAAAKKGFAIASDFDKKHDVTGKAAKGITGMMNGITKALEKKDPAAQASASAAAAQPFVVQCPPGVMPGQVIEVQSPYTGQVVQVQVPPGVAPGGQFQVG